MKALRTVEALPVHHAQVCPGHIELVEAAARLMYVTNMVGGHWADQENAYGTARNILRRVALEVWDDESLNREQMNADIDLTGRGIDIVQVFAEIASEHGWKTELMVAEEPQDYRL